MVGWLTSSSWSCRKLRAPRRPAWSRPVERISSCGSSPCRKNPPAPARILSSAPVPYGNGLQPDRRSKQRLEPIGLAPIALPVRRQLYRLLQDRPEHRVDGRRHVVATDGIDDRPVQESRLRLALGPAEVPPEGGHLFAAGAAHPRL